MKEAIRKRILIVDDNPANIELLLAVLEDDYDILTATNGKRALQIAEKSTKLDLILLDIMMPEMNGYEVCQKLKENDVTESIPVIFVTAMREIESETKGLKLGAADYITKPINPDIVKARVKTHIDFSDKKKEVEYLLSQTLVGSVEVFTDLLAVLNPKAFAYTTHIHNIISKAAIELRVDDIWRFELAALLSKIGCVVSNPSILEKVIDGLELTESEQKDYDEFSQIGAELIAHIPHLEEVAQIISKQILVPSDKELSIDISLWDAIELGGQLIRTVLAFDDLLKQGAAIDEVPLILEEKKHHPQILQLLLTDEIQLIMTQPYQTGVTINVVDLEIGMVLSKDIKTNWGMHLASKGMPLSSSWVTIIQHFAIEQKIPSTVEIQPL